MSQRSIQSTVMALALVACLAAAAGADGPVVRAQVDRNSISLDEQIQLDVVVEGRLNSVEAPQRPPLDDFDVFYRGNSQSVQIVNGDFSASNTFTYMLVPKREGKFTIAPFTFQIGGKELRTQPIAVTVGGGPGVRGAPAPAPGEPEERADRDVFVVAHVDKPHAYVNEQILFTFYLYRAVQLTNVSYSQPSFQGFWVEKLKDSEKQYFKMINGRRYSVTELSTSIFPTTSGTLTIDPATLQLVVLTSPFGFSLFDRGTERVYRTRAIQVQVSPIPAAGKPAIFDGAVGEDLTLDARLDRNEVEEGEPVTLTIKVEGTGNVKTFSKPHLPDLPEFKMYDSDSKTDVQAQDRVAGSRTYEVVLVPKDEGQHVIAPIRMAYFDTREARYRALETKPLTITAVRSSHPELMASGDQPRQQQDIQILGRDIAHIRTDVAIADELTPLYRRGLFAALLPLPMLAAVGALVLQRRRDRLATDVALARATRARKQARRHLSAAARYSKSGRGPEFYAEVSRALLQYTGDKLNVSATGLTHDALRARLAESGASDTTTDRLAQLLERCDAARFAPGSYGGERLAGVLNEAEGLIVELEDSWRRRGTRGQAATLRTAVILLLSGCLAAALVAGATHAVQAQAATAAPAPAAGAAAGSTGSAEPTSAPHSSRSAAPANAERTLFSASDYMPPAEILQRAHAAYEAGSFDEAIDGYLRAEQLGVRNGALYYDLGNAHYKRGDLGHAVASYRRAEMLMPRDPQLRSNLQFVLSRREDKAMQPPDMWLVAQVRHVFRWLSLNEWVALCTLLYVLTCGLLVVRILRRSRGPVLRIGLYTCTALLVLCATLLAFKVHAVRGVRRGVVGTSKVSVMSGPGQDYTAEFSLHEGAEVQVEIQRSDWARVSIGTLRGWVPASSIIPI